MGCDINAILQHKEKNVWVDKKIVNIDRNYGFFSVLAGVRGSFKPISQPRGLPKDFIMHETKTGQFDRCFPNPNEYTRSLHPTPLCTEDNGYQQGYIFIGDHSHSYLTLHEINKYNWAKIKENVFVDDEFRDLFLYCRNLRNWRLVFGFDS